VIELGWHRLFEGFGPRLPRIELHSIAASSATTSLRLTLDLAFHATAASSLERVVLTRQWQGLELKGVEERGLSGAGHAEKVRYRCQFGVVRIWPSAREGRLTLHYQVPRFPQKSTPVGIAVPHVLGFRLPVSGIAGRIGCPITVGPGELVDIVASHGAQEGGSPEFKTWGIVGSPHAWESHGDLVVTRGLLERSGLGGIGRLLETVRGLRSILGRWYGVELAAPIPVYIAGEVASGAGLLPPGIGFDPQELETATDQVLAWRVATQLSRLWWGGMVRVGGREGFTREEAVALGSAIIALQQAGYGRLVAALSLRQAKVIRLSRLRRLQHWLAGLMPQPELAARVQYFVANEKDSHSSLRKETIAGWGRVVDSEVTVPWMEASGNRRGGDGSV
jgi:hypothetical protein